MDQASNPTRLSTADLVQRAHNADSMPAAADASLSDRDDLVELFEADVARAFKSRWDEVQISFVDDPTRAVKQADELVAEVMTSLAESFSRERTQLEGVVQSASDGRSTEDLRVALRRYRSFFQRLLSL